MREKSARCATSLSKAGLRAHQAANDSLGAIDFNEIAIAKPSCSPRDRHHSGDAHLPRNDRRMRKQAAPFDDQTCRRRKQHDPPRIGPFGYQYAANGERCRVRVCHHLHSTSNFADATSQSMTLFPREVRLPRRGGGWKIRRVMHWTIGLETIRGCRLSAELMEFSLADRNQFFEVRGNNGAVHESQHFFDLKIEDVARAFEPIQRVQPDSDFHEDAAHSSEESCALKSKILSSADALTGVLENPGEDHAAKRTPAQNLPHALFRRDYAMFLRFRNRHRSVPLREFANTAQQQRRIVVQGGAFQFQLLETTLPESRKVLVIFLTQIGSSSDGACAFRRHTAAERLHKFRIAGSDSGHFAQTHCRFYADHSTLGTHQLVCEFVAACEPALAKSP